MLGVTVRDFILLFRIAGREERRDGYRMTSGIKRCYANMSTPQRNTNIMYYKYVLIKLMNCLFLEFFI